MTECIYPSKLATFFKNSQLVDLIVWHHRVVAEVGYHLGPAAGAEADRRRAVGSGHRAEGHAGGVGAQSGGGCQVFSVREKTFTPLPQTCTLSFQGGKQLSSLGVSVSNTVDEIGSAKKRDVSKPLTCYSKLNSAAKSGTWRCPVFPNEATMSPILQKFPYRLVKPIAYMPYKGPYPFSCTVLRDMTSVKLTGEVIGGRSWRHVVLGKAGSQSGQQASRTAHNTSPAVGTQQSSLYTNRCAPWRYLLQQVSSLFGSTSLSEGVLISKSEFG